MMERQNKNNRNLADCLSKIFYLYFGKLITRINCPFIVEKLVLATRTGTPDFSLKWSNFTDFFLLPTWIRFVPSKMYEVFKSYALVNGSGFFSTGTDSPVRAHSLIKASHSSKTPSKGILI